MGNLPWNIAPWIRKKVSPVPYFLSGAVKEPLSLLNLQSAFDLGGYFLKFFLGKMEAVPEIHVAH